MSDQQMNEINSGQYVSFKLGKEEYCIPILKVREIIRYNTLTRIPQSPEFIDGVLNLRGQVIPVVNLRRKFGLIEQELDVSTRIIVVEIQDRIVGFVVDQVSEVLEIDSSEVEPPPQMSSMVRNEFICGMGKVGDQLLIILDIDKILTTDDQTILETQLEPAMA